MKKYVILTVAAGSALLSVSSAARAQLADFPCNQDSTSGFECVTIEGYSNAGGLSVTANDSIAIVASANSPHGYPAIEGDNASAGAGVYGTSQTGKGVYGSTSTGSGVEGDSSSGYGVFGKTFASSGFGAAGVYGLAPASGWGVHGQVNPPGVGTAIYGDNNSNVANAWAGYFNGNVYTTGMYHSSDIRLKTNVKPLESSLDTLLKLRGVSFEWKDPQRGTGLQSGFIAQEVEKVFPQWVGVDANGYKAIATPGLEALTVESIRSLKVENDQLKTRIKALEDGRRPVISGFGEGSAGVGLLAVAGAVLVSRRRRSDVAA